MDLSEPGQSGGGRIKEQRRRSPLRRKAGSLSPRRHSRPKDTDLVQVEAEFQPDRISLGAGIPRTHVTSLTNYYIFVSGEPIRNKWAEIQS